VNTLVLAWLHVVKNVRLKKSAWQIVAKLVLQSTWVLTKLAAKKKILKHALLIQLNAKRKKKVVLAAKTNTSF
jgi:hypothetical protein